MHQILQKLQSFFEGEVKRAWLKQMPNTMLIFCENWNFMENGNHYIMKGENQITINRNQKQNFFSDTFQKYLYGPVFTIQLEIKQSI